MRATLTSLAVLALLCPLQVCSAQDAPPDKATVEAATAAAKTSEGADETTSQKLGKGRVGTLSPNEAKRAARARKRAAAALKGNHPAVDTTEHNPTKSEPIKAAETPPKANAPVKAAEAPSAAKEPVKKAETPAATDGKTLKADVSGAAKQPLKEAAAPAAKEPVKWKRVASRRARVPRVQYTYAGSAGRAPRVGEVVAPGVRLDPLPPRYRRAGSRNGPVVIVEGPRRRFFDDRPRPVWRFVPSQPYVAGYPPYPSPDVALGYGAYAPPPPVYEVPY